MSAWTLGQVKASNLALEGYCQTEGCDRFYVFDVDQLIEGAGPDFEVPEFIPNVNCTRCGGRLKVHLAAIPPGQDT
ncbi:MAG: hypothetical protein ACRECO_02845 [Xanthobacteraceae bacterium]